jgi:hypothetical protein
MTEELHFSKLSILTSGKRHTILEDGILHPYSSSGKDREADPIGPSEGSNMIPVIGQNPSDSDQYDVVLSTDSYWQNVYMEFGGRSKKALNSLGISLLHAGVRLTHSS